MYAFFFQKIEGKYKKAMLFILKTFILLVDWKNIMVCISCFTTDLFKMSQKTPFIISSCKGVKFFSISLQYSYGHFEIRRHGNIHTW